MNCSEFLEHISEFLDGEMASREISLCKAHLDHCSECRQEVQFLIESSSTLHENLPILEPSPEMWLAVYGEIKLQKRLPRATWFKMPKLAYVAVVVLVLFTGITILHNYRKMSAFNTKKVLQSELSTYLKQRDEIIKRGSPFEEGDPLKTIKNNGNPFSPFVETVPKDPFKELQ